MFFPDLFLKSVLPGKDSASLYLNSSKVDKTPSSEEKKFNFSLDFFQIHFVIIFVLCGNKSFLSGMISCPQFQKL